jgi:hypothetical protein
MKLPIDLFYTTCYVIYAHPHGFRLTYRFVSASFDSVFGAWLLLHHPLELIAYIVYVNEFYIDVMVLYPFIVYIFVNSTEYGLWSLICRPGRIRASS